MPCRSVNLSLKTSADTVTFKSAEKTVIIGKRTLACEKLKFTKSGVEKIAFECGFHSSMYFCRLFKETFGLTPGEYRKREQL